MTDSKTPSYEALHQALALTGGGIAAAGYGERVESITSMISQEPELAFSILCSNLHEFDCPVPIEAYKILEELGLCYAASEWGSSLGITSATWEDLRPLIFA